MKKFISSVLLVLMILSCAVLSVSANSLGVSISSSPIDFDYAAMRNAINSGDIKVYNDKPSVLAMSGEVAPASTTYSVSSVTGTTATETGQYPSRRGMYLVTNSIVHTGDLHSSITGHAGMVYGTQWTIESYPVGGVQEKHDKWTDRYNDVIAATTNATTIQEDQYIAFYCYQHLGDEYNFIYTNYATEERFYCSQLVYKAFLEVQEIDLKIPTATVVTPGSLVRTQLVENDVITIVYTYEAG